jgi:hypothetical protein
MTDVEEAKSAFDQGEQKHRRNDREQEARQPEAQAGGCG